MDGWKLHEATMKIEPLQQCITPCGRQKAYCACTESR